MPTLVTSDGPLWYDVAGSGSVVVLMHGGLLDSSMWDEHIGPLASLHTVVRFDLRNHGRSGTSTGAFTPSRDVEELLAALGFQSATLVGLSYGARVAVDVALTAPERVDGLVVVSPGISGMEFRDPFIVDLGHQQDEAVARGDSGQFVELFLRQWVDGPHRRPDEVDPMVRERCRTMATATVAGHHTAVDAMQELRAVDRLDELRADTLIIVGARDSSDIHRASELLELGNPAARCLELGGTAHMPPMERSEEFQRVVLNFLGSNSETGRGL